MGYGQNMHLGISFQDSFGESNINSMDYFKIVSESLSENIGWIDDPSLASGYDDIDQYKGPQSVQGDIVAMVHPILIGKLFKAWAGQSSMHDYVGSCYQHLMPPVGQDFIKEVAAIQPISIEVYRDTGSAFLYWDAMVNMLTVEIAQGALYKVTAGIIGARFDFLEKSTPSFEEGSFYTWNTTSVSLGGVGISHISNLTMKLDNKLAANSYLDGNIYPGRILRTGRRTVDANGTMLLSGDAEYRKWRAGTKQHMTVAATDPSTVMNAHNQITFDFPQFKYTEFPANVGGPGLISVAFAGKALLDSSSNYAVQLTVTNTHAAY